MIKQTVDETIEKIKDKGRHICVELKDLLNSSYSSAYQKGIDDAVKIIENDFNFEVKNYFGGYLMIDTLQSKSNFLATATSHLKNVINHNGYSYYIPKDLTSRYGCYYLKSDIGYDFDVMDYELIKKDFYKDFEFEIDMIRQFYNNATLRIGFLSWKETNEENK